MFVNDPHLCSSIKMLAIKSKANYEVYDSIANCISKSPEAFASPEIFAALLQHVVQCADVGSVMKCLALLVSCQKGLEIAQDNELITVLVSILTNSSTEQETYIHSINAFKHLSLNKKILNNFLVPWKLITKLLIKHSSTIDDAKLQQSSLQALRFLSDKQSVKRDLREKHKSMLRQIICLSGVAKALKSELMQNLEYRNYKLQKSVKHSIPFK
jgi:hypothetical protein